MFFSVLGDKLLSAYSQIRYDVMEVGIMHPEQTSTGYLYVRSTNDDETKAMRYYKL